MNTKTKEAIIRHGNALLAAFPNATERDPAALCKKLRRIETAFERHAVNLCNVPNYQGTYNKERGRAAIRVYDLLGRAELIKAGFFINGDPRGYALKLDDEWTRQHNLSNETQLHRDFGGYGILAPDLTA